MMPYPEPFMEEERANYPPGTHFLERHDERENIVDRRKLTLKVVRRFPEIPSTEIRA
jgi:hypothetical protein